MSELTFCSVLQNVIANDQNYEKRYSLILRLMYLANDLGYNAGWRFDPDEPEWPVAVVDLPGNGQVSWHCPAIKLHYDGHTTKQKIERCTAYLEEHVP